MRSPSAPRRARSAWETGGFPMASLSSPAAGRRFMPHKRGARRCSRSRPCSTHRTPTPRRHQPRGRDGALSRPCAFSGPTWLITGKEESTLAGLADEVLVVTPEIEESHATRRATPPRWPRRRLRGEDVSGSPAAVERVLEEEPLELFEGEGRRGRRRQGLADRPGGRQEAARGRRPPQAPRRTTRSRSCTATSPPSTRPSASSSSRARAALPSGPRTS